ncbi:hypothetical protein J7T55_002643 [Diaporthe amygdali]|uniref:uncharacterized protein n=1 Tax=Phomopsis amygdali TaxID=1214568 RepID=UPI0022FDD5C0|nr:uncharacterized protein J7T55_002643 [Diaporthe amygdali]KAJ0122131.1 hypothetical protein J7T55_002643 [Diaporthe amygdali]
MSERTPTVIRRPHKKARTGCTLCKKRRVKVSRNESKTAGSQVRILMDRQCGEEKPQCTNCRIHSATCVYEVVKSRRSSPKAPAPGPATPSSQGDFPLYTLEHMELLHHYTASTALTLSSTAEVREVWQNRVPRLALHADYVLHALLALSALHLAQIRPESRQSYWATGVHLYQEALGKAQAEMEHVTAKNCTELYIFSTMTCFYSLAQNCELARRLDQGENVDDEEMDLLSWVFLLRGNRALILPPHGIVLHTGVLAPMFEAGGKRATKLRAYSTPDKGSIMEELCDIVPDDAEQAIYRDAVQHLQQAFHAVYNQPGGDIQTTELFVWVFEVSDEYMERLKREEGPALAIFICYSLLVGNFKGRWWSEGWGEWVSGRLRARLLDGERKFSDKLMELLAGANDDRLDAA